MGMITHYKTWISILVACVLSLGVAGFAWAQIPGADLLKQAGDAITALFPTNGNFYNDTCTWQGSFWMPNLVLPIVQAVVFILDALVTNSMQDLFDGIVGDVDDYASTIIAAATLAIVFYGVGILTGLVKVTLYDAVIRIAKIGFCVTMLQPNAWTAYEETFVAFFQDGILDLIEIVVDIGRTSLSIGPVGFSLSAGGVGVAITSGVTGPISIFADVMNMLFTPRMFVLIWACFNTGSPYGMAMGVALGWAAWQALTMFLLTLEVYCLSILARAILLGVGPIFFGFMMFKKTMVIFKNWVNQLVSFSLQPIFMFAFLSFFIGLIESAVNSTVPRGVVEACYTKATGTNTPTGTLYDMQSWRFAYKGEAFEGVLGNRGHENNPDALKGGFPIDVISILILLVLTYTGKQLVHVAANLANDIAGGATSLLSKQ